MNRLPRRTQRAGWGTERGQALVIALIVLLFLTIIIGSATVGLRVEGQLASLHANNFRARYAALAGIESALCELAADRNDVDHLNEGWHVAADDGVFHKTGLGDAEFEVRYMCPETDAWQFGVVDEERKLNVNKATKGMLMALFREEVVADAVLAKRPFTTVDELAFLAGVDDACFRRIQAFVTVAGEGRINVNTAGADVLKCFVSEENAGKIVGFRNGEDKKPLTEDDQYFESISALQKELKLSDRDFKDVAGHLTVQSSWFTVDAFARLPEAMPPLVRHYRAAVRRDAKGIEIVQVAPAP